MSKDGDESADSDPSVSEESSDDGYSNDGFEYRHYHNPMMRFVPVAIRSDVRKLCKDTARLYERRTPIRRTALHYRIVEEEPQTCMQKDCNKLAFGKCGTCHAFLCIDSDYDCFAKFHNMR